MTVLAPVNDPATPKAESCGNGTRPADVISANFHLAAFDTDIAPDVWTMYRFRAAGKVMPVLPPQLPMSDWLEKSRLADPAKVIS